jgi:hypothetical protein
MCRAPSVECHRLGAAREHGHDFSRFPCIRSTETIRHKTHEGHKAVTFLGLLKILRERRMPLVPRVGKTTPEGESGLPGKSTATFGFNRVRVERS